MPECRAPNQRLIFWRETLVKPPCLVWGFSHVFTSEMAGDGDKNVDRHRDSVASSDDRLLQRCSPANVGCYPWGRGCPRVRVMGEDSIGMAPSKWWDLYIHIHIHIYIMYIYIFVYIYVYIYIYICDYFSVYEYVYIYIYMFRSCLALIPSPY